MRRIPTYGRKTARRSVLQAAKIQYRLSRSCATLRAANRHFGPDGRSGHSPVFRHVRLRPAKRPLYRQKPRTGIHRLPLRDKRILLYGLLSEEIGKPIHLEAKSHRTATIRPTWKSKGVFAAFGRRRKTESQPLFIQLHEAGFGGILSEIRLFVAIGHSIGTNEINP